MHALIRVCVACPLHESRTNAVPGEGDPNARLMLIGEAPGEKEDLEGKPFRGRSGRFLDQLLAGAGITRNEIYITSCVKCRPPANRNPRDHELATCRTLWLEPQIKLIDPKLIVLMGKIAARMVGETGLLKKLHGRLVECNGRSHVLTYHPAAGMRFPEIRDAMISDFRTIRELHFRG